MKILVAVKGSEGETFYRRLSRLAAVREADRVLLIHVVDEGNREHVERGRDRFLDHRRLSPERERELRSAEDENARAALTAARASLETAGVPAERLDDVVLRGRPNETIRDLAAREEFDLLVVAGRPGKLGPHSVGKTARFLIDHCPTAALLVRS